MANNKNEEKKVLVKIDNLRQYFSIKGSGFRAEEKFVRANDGISINIYEGETFGLVGESGCGKSTLGRSLLQLYTQTAGRTIYYGKSLAEINPTYIRTSLNNFAREKERLEELDKQRDEAYQLFENTDLDNKDERQKALDAYNRQDNEYKVLEATLFGLAGILIKDSDSTKVAKLLLDHHNAKVELFKAQETGKNITAAEKRLEDSLEAIKQEKEKYQDDPDFKSYEARLEDGVDLTKLTTEESRKFRKELQLIFQDPYSSLNPKMSVGQIISEGLYAHNVFKKGDKGLQDYVIDTMEECGLAPYFLHRYPHQFSGGQRQRIGIARSVALKPKFIVCDEAVSALDVSIQSQIINLLLDLKEKENLTYMFISHDLSVIKYISDRVGVMYLGNIVELAETENLYKRPMHPYTEALLSAIPTTDDVRKEVIIMEGDIPSPVTPPLGCKFHTRCSTLR